MPYFLEHHFDPDFDHTQLRPEDTQGRVNHYELGYAQTVKKGALLAKWREVLDTNGLDSRFVYEEKTFPMGMGCMVDPENTDSLVAMADGYVFYMNGKISVKSVLNVRGDVDFHTGNIHFVGDVVVHGGVRSGFTVEGKSVLVREVVEAATIRAEDTIQTESGIKGGGKAILRANGRITVPFCENARLTTRDNLVIKGSAVQCSLYVGENLAVSERLVGGTTVCRGTVYVGKVLGGGTGETQLVLAYDPMLILESDKLEKRIAFVGEELRKIRNLGRNKNEPTADEVKAAVELDAEFESLKLFKRKLWQKIHRRERLSQCQVVVPGEVRPGVEISIGCAYFKVTEPLNNVSFRREGHDIVIVSPALS